MKLSENRDAVEAIARRRMPRGPENFSLHWSRLCNSARWDLEAAEPFIADPVVLVEAIEAQLEVLQRVPQTSLLGKSRNDLRAALVLYKAQLSEETE